MTEKLPLPNLLIGGVHKAGTTSLHTYLSMHPQVCGSLIKELAFLLPARYHKPVPDNITYASHFRNYSNEKYILETTPSYLYGDKSLLDVVDQRLGSDIKVIMILREPKDRFISFYRHCITKLEIPATTTLDEFIQQSVPLNSGVRNDDEVNHISQGLVEGDYATYLPLWMKHYGDNLLILFFDELSKDTTGTMKKICNFLNIDFNFYKPSDFKIENRTVDYKLGFVHGFALWANHHTEKFWRKNIKLKRALRSLYYGFNEKKSDTSDYASPKSLKDLEEIYKNPNKKLSDLLKNHPNINLPFWLQ
jgi:hypothetical protein